MATAKNQKFSLNDPHTGEILEYSEADVETAFQNLKFGKALSQKDYVFLSSKIGMRTVEYPDNTPLEPPIGHIEQVPIHVQIAQMVRSERLRQEAEAAGAESFDDADDFDVDDDPEIFSGFENDFETPLHDLRTRREIKEAEEKALAAATTPGTPPKSDSPARGEGGAQPPTESKQSA